MKGFWKDFKAFISKGNIIDLAIAVVIGAAFGKIVTSLVNDIIMPLISLATGGVSISDWKWVITPASDGIAESALYYGSFLQTVLDFLIISFFIFLAIRILQKSKEKIDLVAQDIKDDIKKRKKRGKKGQEKIIEQPVIENAEVVVQAEENKKEVIEKSEENKDTILTSIKSIAKSNKKSNKSQEDLLREIRDLLKNKA